MRGKTMNGKTMSLLVMLLFAFVALFVPEGGMATDIPCPVDGGGFRTHYSSPTGPQGTFCVNPIKLADLTSCGSVPCYRFEYEIRSLLGESLSQVALTIPAAKFCRIAILSPTERSVKIREYEPSTNFSFVDTNTDVITWDALKLDPSNKKNIDVYLTQVGAGDQVMELKTETGPQYVNIAGPICCAPTQIPSQIRFHPKAFGNITSTGDDITIRYDACTGEPLAAQTSFELLPYGAFICEGDDFGYDSKKCVKIRKLGPNFGAPLVAVGASFYGWGNRIYKGPPIQDQLIQDSCVSGVYKEVVNYNNGIMAKFDECGNAIGFSSDGVTPLSAVTLWIGVARENGRIDTSQVFRVLAGPRNGSIIDANPSYLCVVYGIGCSR